MDVILLTNRTVQAFDLRGDEMMHISKSFAIQPGAQSEDVERKILDELWETLVNLSDTGEDVRFYIASVRGVCWKQEISLSEMAAMLGHGQWYWETQNLRHEGYAG